MDNRVSSSVPSGPVLGQTSTSPSGYRTSFASFSPSQQQVSSSVNPYLPQGVVTQGVPIQQSSFLQNVPQMSSQGVVTQLNPYQRAFQTSIVQPLSSVSSSVSQPLSSVTTVSPSMTSITPSFLQNMPQVPPYNPLQSLTTVQSIPSQSLLQNIPQQSSVVTQVNPYDIAFQRNVSSSVITPQSSFITPQGVMLQNPQLMVPQSSIITPVVSQNNPYLSSISSSLVSKDVDIPIRSTPSISSSRPRQDDVYVMTSKRNGQNERDRRRVGDIKLSPTVTQLMNAISNDNTSPPSVSSLLTSNIFSSELMYTVLLACDRGLYDINEVMINAVLAMQRDSGYYDLFIVAARNADVNIYLTYGNLGNVHLLAYISSVMPQQYVDEALAYLVSLGSRLNSMIGDDTVVSWMMKRGLNNILTRDTRSISQQDVIIQGNISLLNDTGTASTMREYEKGIRLYCKNILSQFSDSNDIAQLLFLWCVRYLSDECMNSLLDNGYEPEYTVINTLCINAVVYKRTNNIAAMLSCSFMIKESIRHGASIDRDQLDLLGSISLSLMNEVTMLYNRPYWMKTCEVRDNRAPITNKLRRLMYKVGATTNTNKSTMCEIAQEVSSNPQGYIERTRSTQASRISSVSSTPGDILCINYSQLDYDPEDYIGDHLAYYTEQSGDNYCYPSSEYPDILTSRVNTITNTLYPEEFLDQVALKKKNIDRIDPSLTDITVELGVDNLLEDDRIEKNDDIINQLYNLAFDYSISKASFQSYTISSLEEALNSIVPIDLQHLTPHHSMVTIANYVVNMNEEDRRRFFNKVKSMH